MLITLNYKIRYKVENLVFESKDLITGMEDARVYCKNHGITFLSVHPFLTDIKKEPSDATKK